MVAFTQITPVDITPVSSAVWTTTDVSSHVTSASGVLLRINYSAGTSSDTVGLRKTGSTDSDLWSNPDNGGAYYCCGIDGSNQLDIYTQSGGAGSPTVEIYGYFDSTDTVFFTEPPRYQANGTYTDIDISTDTGGDTAIGAIIQITNERGTNADFACRPKGSVTDHYDQLSALCAIGAVIIGVDGSEIFEAKQSSSFAGSAFKIMGYVKTGMTFYDDPQDKSLSTTGSYQTITIPTSSGGLFRVRGVADATAGIRKDSGTDPFDNIGASVEQSAVVVEAVSNDVEGKIDVTTTDFFLWGIVDADGGITITADSGTYTLSGTTITLKAAFSTVVATGTYSLSGTAAGLRAGRNTSAGSGTYTLTGTDVALRTARATIAASGTYNLTGTDVTLIYTPASGEVLTIDSGSFALTGSTVGLIAARKTAIDSGNYSLTGQSISLRYDANVISDSGSYALTGTDLALVADYGIISISGSYTLTGTSVTLKYSGDVTQTIGTVTASFAESGISANYKDNDVSVTYEANSITVNFKG